MPPDVLNRDRLEKVLKGLEAEAAAEELLASTLSKKTQTNVQEEVQDLPDYAAAAAAASSPLSSSPIKHFERCGPFIYVAEGSFGGYVWSRIVFFGLLHSLYAIALYQLAMNWNATTVKTWLFAWVMFTWSALGVTAGAHRLWSHKSYQAKWPVRVFLMLGHCLAGQNTLYHWCRDHRVHHKHSETDLDPHNSKRGFFFAHIGWLLVKSHPEYAAASRTTYVQDLMKDPVVYFQHYRYKELCVLFALVLPMFVPIYFWGESASMAFFLAVIVRYVTCLHNTWFVNSAAHMFGERPYNEKIQPRQNPAVSFGALGEGYHNFHHSYPFDYATSELGVGSLNWTKNFIDFMFKLGLTYDLKVAHLSRERKTAH